jgi:hypothetical protein
MFDAYERELYSVPGSGLGEALPAYVDPALVEVGQGSRHYQLVAATW